MVCKSLSPTRPNVQLYEVEVLLTLSTVKFQISHCSFYYDYYSILEPGFRMLPLFQQSLHLAHRNQESNLSWEQ